MSFKFKEGDLVEMIKSNYGYEGHRFVIGRHEFSRLKNNAGNIVNNANCYETELKVDGGCSKFRWATEDQLKLVNPDIDEISDSTFSEIMDEITEAITVEQ